MDVIMPKLLYYELIALIGITCIGLLGKPYLLIGYITGVGINVGLNIVLKRWIAEPRPCVNNEQFKILMKHPSTVPTEMFGMPSGHAQLFAFSLLYVVLSTHQWYIYTIYSLAFVASCIQRVWTRAHTIVQVVVGSAIGVILAYGIYRVVVSLIKLRYPQGVEPNNSPFGSIL